MKHEPYIPAESTLREFSLFPLIVGVLLGMVFGASSLYLVLKVGLTVSASIPVAVISITFFKVLERLRLRSSATILENNLVQTAGSAGESIAFGVGVTMPAIMILGFDLEITRVMTVAVLGGLLGILMMIPLRRPLIVQQHGTLKYPEGTACAEVLKAGANTASREAASEQARLEAETRGGSTSAVVIFVGFLIGLVYKTCNAALKLWKEVPERVFGAPLKAASVGAEISPELLGVGYIIGPKTACVMCGGGVLAYLVLIPLIKFFGDGLPGPLPPGSVPISTMGPGEIRGAYILYIGAGAVAAGGIVSLLRSLPTIWHGLTEGLKDLRGAAAGADHRPRTDQDLSMKWVVAGILVLVAALMLVPTLHMNVLGALLVVLFGFLFVTVSSRLTGEIGSSSNPISGMTVATLLLTCLIFLLMGWTGGAYYVTALSIGAVVCIAASNGGTTSQDLKTGFLVGATPRLQQIAILLGAFASALILGPILLGLNQSSTVYVPRITFEQVEPPVATTPGVAAEGPPDLRMPPGGPWRVQRVPEGQALEAGEYLVDPNGSAHWRLKENFPAGMHAENPGGSERLRGPQATEDPGEYRAWHKTSTEGGPEGKYLVDEAGVPVYLVDPGINGKHPHRPDGTSVTKFDAPKATLMSYIIKGILNRELPWTLVLLGVMIALVLELAGIPSLAFAVGVYLPLSSSTPIMVGGVVRWLVDRWLASTRDVGSPEELAAEGDRSPGVLMASGYIAGGAIAGIVLALVSVSFSTFARAMEEWSSQHNPFYAGPYADALALLPFLGLAVLLYMTGRELLFGARRSSP
ncbi:MAG: oligopeptide transporter, OPT family [Candidatus Eremiobacterota bacterium]